MSTLRNTALEVIQEHSEGITHAKLVAEVLQKGYKNNKDLSRRLYFTVTELANTGVLKKNPETREIKYPDNYQKRELCYA